MTRLTPFLLITRRAGLLLMVCGLAVCASREIAAEPAAERPLKAYRLRHLPAAEVKEQLTKALATLPERTKVAVDARGNRILLRGTARAHQLTAKVIQSLDRIPIAQPNQRRTTRHRTLDASTAVARPPGHRSLRLRHVKWNDIHRSLQKLAGRPIPFTTQQGDPLTIYTLDTAGAGNVEMHVNLLAQSIDLRGPSALVSAWSRVILALDRPAASKADRTHLVPLRFSDRSQVQAALTAYQSNPPSGNTAPRHDVRATVAGKSSAATPRPAFELMAALFQDDTKKADAPKDPPAKKQPVPVVDRDNALPAGDAAGLVGDVQIEFLEGLDVIVIRGHQRDVERLTKIIEEIERLSAETKPMIEVLHLKFVDSEALGTLVNELYGEVLSPHQGRVSVTALVKPNALLLIGRDEAVTAVKELVGKLDQPVPPSTQFHVFQLRYAVVADALSTIQQFFGDRVSFAQNVRPGLGTKVLVTADVRTNALVVRASPRDLDELEDLIRQIDTPSGQAINELRVFRLENSLAEELAPVIQEAISTGVAQQRTGGQPQATRPGTTGAGTSGKSIALQFLTIDGQDRRLLKSGIMADVQVTADPRANALIVSAPAESMDLLAALIRQLDQTPAAEAQIKVFTMLNADAVSLVEMLENLFGSFTNPREGVLASAIAGGDNTLIRLRFSVDQRTNSIIASGSVADLNVVEAILLRLDESDVRERKSVVYRLKNAPAVDVANAINEFLRSERQVEQTSPELLSPFEQIEREVIVVPEAVSNSLIISATPRFFEEVKRLVVQLDERPPMVMIQVVIAEVRLNDLDEFGVELGLQDTTLFNRSLLENIVTTTNSTSVSTPGGVTTTTNEIIRAASNVPGYNFNNFPLGNSGADSSLGTAGTVGGQALSHFALGRTNTELGYGGLVLSASSGNVSALLRALQETRRLEILSRPQVMTLDNQPAFIQVGQRVPRITASNISETGTVNTTVLENVGILLGVTPRISPDGLVVMEIDAEKSKVGPEAEGIPISINANGDVIRSPRIDTTTAQTTVSAVSGQTIVLGGLITRAESTSSRRVPFLSNIPILGDMFRYDNVTTERTELLIIMTPIIVRNEEDAEWIKQTETARMSWVMCDVMDLHGDAGLRGRSDEWQDDEAETIYPDHEASEPVPPRPIPTPNGQTNRPARQGIPERGPTRLEFREVRPAQYRQRGQTSSGVRWADYQSQSTNRPRSIQAIRLPPVTRR